MPEAKRCRACKDVIEKDWWLKPCYALDIAQMALAAEYCEDCGREKLLGILEAPRSAQDRRLAGLDHNEAENRGEHWESD